MFRAWRSLSVSDDKDDETPYLDGAIAIAIADGVFEDEEEQDDEKEHEDNDKTVDASSASSSSSVSSLLLWVLMLLLMASCTELADALSRRREPSGSPLTTRLVALLPLFPGKSILPGPQHNTSCSLSLFPRGLPHRAWTVRSLLCKARVSYV